MHHGWILARYSVTWLSECRVCHVARWPVINSQLRICHPDAHKIGLWYLYLYTVQHMQRKTYILYELYQVLCKIITTKKLIQVVFLLIAASLLMFLGTCS